MPRCDSGALVAVFAAGTGVVVDVVTASDVDGVASGNDVVIAGTVVLMSVGTEDDVDGG